MQPQSDRTASRAEPSQDETSRADARDAAPHERLVDAFVLCRHRLPTPAQQKVLADYLRAFDVTGPDRGERVILGHPDDPIGAIKADLEEFRKERLAALPEQEHHHAFYGYPIERCECGAERNRTA